MSPATVPQITYLNLHILINQRPSLMLFHLLCLFNCLCLPSLKLLMLHGYPLLYLILLYKVLLYLSAEVTIIYKLILLSLLIHCQPWQ